MALSITPTIALTNVTLDIMSKFHIPNNIIIRLKHFLILKYIEIKYKHIIEDYKKCPPK